MTPVKKGKGGRPRSKSQISKAPGSRQTFKWTAEFHFQMANYVRDNYAAYKTALGTSRKMQFLRKMRDALGLSADDTQMKNGFINFMKKYNEVSEKLNSTGFGIDPERDSSIQKGWIDKVCPYYGILEEVVGSKPNIVPPSTVSTSTITIGDPETDDSPVNDPDVRGDTNDTPDKTVEDSDNPGSESNQLNENLDANEGVKQYVRDAFKGLTKNGTDTSPKSAMGVYSKLMTEKLQESTKLEREKLLQKEAQFTVEMDLQKERNSIELTKVNHLMQIEQRRLELEFQKLEETKLERAHELEKLRLTQEFELKKLELQYSKPN